MRSGVLPRIVNAVLGTLLLCVGAGGFLWPAFELGRAICCETLAADAPPRAAARWHRAYASAFARWAAARRGSDAASKLSQHDIAGTEWPLFGTVFFLRASENLEAHWATIGDGVPPSIHAREALDAGAALLADPEQAHWVMRHWGRDRYLSRENVFYRMLLIDGLATHARLTGATAHLALLREQTRSLAAELDRSATGLLADYPGQTFPADVAAAWRAILGADRVLGTDHSALARRGLRGFVGQMAPELGLPPYAWFGEHMPEATEVRGSANAWLLTHAPWLWPDAAQSWYATHVREFGHTGFWLSGYREYARSSPDPVSDIDSGPVIAGLGTSATAFGLGVARLMGDEARARPIALEMIAASWPLPNGRLLVPRMLSDFSDAPLLGEAGVLFAMTQPRAPGVVARSDPARWQDVPGVVWATLLLQTALGLGGVWRGGVRLAHAMRARAAA